MSLVDGVRGPPDELDVQSGLSPVAHDGCKFQRAGLRIFGPLDLVQFYRNDRQGVRGRRLLREASGCKNWRCKNWDRKKERERQEKRKTSHCCSDQMKTESLDRGRAIAQFDHQLHEIAGKGPARPVLRGCERNITIV